VLGIKSWPNRIDTAFKQHTPEANAELFNIINLLWKVYLKNNRLSRAARRLMGRRRTDAKQSDRASAGSGRKELRASFRPTIQTRELLKLRPIVLTLGNRDEISYLCL
jgi:hypothetical protein